MKVRMFVLRVLRKLFHVTRRLFELLARVPSLAAFRLFRVEMGLSNRINGIVTDVPKHRAVSLEQVVYSGIPFNLAPLNPALPGLGRMGSVTLLIPSLQQSSFFGGTATALIVAARLAEHMAKPLRIVETLEPGGTRGLDKFYADLSLPQFNERSVELIDVSSRRHDIYGYLDLHPDDDFVASAWWDAYLLQKLPLRRPFVYLVQDYEPIFYANGDKSLLAENTYQGEHFIPLCNTRLMFDFMAARYPRFVSHGVWFEPAVARVPSRRSQADKRRLFFYARPSVERNLFYTGLLALDRALSTGVLEPGDWEIVAAGEDRIPDIALSSGATVKNLGKLSAEEYESFVRTVDLAVSLMMAPHPNYPTLELASSGSSVVTTRYGAKVDLSAYSKNIVVADLTVEGIVEGIRQASSMTPEQLYANAVEPSLLAPSWSESLAEPISRVVKALEGAGAVKDGTPA